MADLIKHVYSELSNKKDITKKEAQERGYAFERIIYEILSREKLEPLASYKIDGEQIDGSFFCFGQTFLLEAKWEDKKLPASAIYTFKGKLDGKFHTSSGVFISMGGYSDETELALRFGKSINILLFDKNDMDAIIYKDVSFVDVLKFKLRQAGDTGKPFVNYKIRETAQKIIQSPAILSGTTETVVQQKTIDRKTYFDSDIKPMFLIICEGITEQKNIEEIIINLNLEKIIAYQFEILDGVYNIMNFIPSITNIMSMENKNYDLKGVIIILEKDEHSEKVTGDFKRNNDELLLKNSTPIKVEFINIDWSHILLTLKLQGFQNIEDYEELRRLKKFIGDNM